MNLRDFISGFLERKGFQVLNAMVLAKIIGFLVSIVMIWLLSKEDYGDFTYAFTAVSFLVPFLGFGAYQSFVYYGARTESLEKKNQLFNYAFKQGMKWSAILSVLLILSASLITINRPNSYGLLIILSLHILTFSLVEFIRNYTRLIERNDLYALSENWYNILLLALASLGAYLFQSAGYAWALVVSPLVIGLIYLKKSGVQLNTPKSPNFFVPKGFWKYGIFVSLGAVAAKMLYIVDILTIGNFLNESHMAAASAVQNTSSTTLPTFISEQTAIYRVCSLIPIASFVIPVALLTTDFVKVSENSRNKAFLKNYTVNMFKLLFPIGLLGAGVLHFGRDYILMIFGEEYAGNGELLSVFALAVIGAFTLRVPFGNLLSAVGKANWNAYIAFGVLVVNVFLNYYLVSSYGILGAAWATTILIWVSGVVNYLVYLVYLKNI